MREREREREKERKKEREREILTKTAHKGQIIGSAEALPI